MIFAYVVGTMIGVGVGVWAYRARLRERQEAARIGGAFEVPVKLRLLGASGLGRRCREGLLHRVDDKLVFRARKPRLGRDIHLSGASIKGSRPMKPTEKTWFFHPTVLVIEGRAGAMELGFASDNYLRLARDLIGSDNQD